MNRMSDFLAGRRVLAEVDSPVNGKLLVIRDLAWGTYIQSKKENITQSGGIAKAIWKTSLKRIYESTNLRISSTLILGLGGGGMVRVIKKYWPEAKIFGVDIDPIIVDLGKKYLGLNENEVEIHIADAYDSVISHQSLVISFDLICIDLYIGDQFPKKFESEKFLRGVRKLLSRNGVAVFNRLYYGENRSLATKFGKKLEKVFVKVDYIYPEANLMFACRV